MIADTIKLEWDEDGLHMRIETTEDDSVLDFWVSEPEQLYNNVCAAVWPWIVERDEALREHRAGMALARDVMADARDALERKP